MQRLLEQLNKSFTLQTDLESTNTPNITVTTKTTNDDDDNDDEEENYKIVPGREIQYKKLNAFINNHIKSHEGSSLYICGQPGTGKSLTLSTLSKNLPKKKCKTIYINCMALSQPSKIYIEIYRRLNNLKSTKKTINESLELIESNFFYNYKDSKDGKNEELKENRYGEKSIILILDEVDILIEKYNKLLYRIFEWPYRDSSKLILFGIANDLSLVEKSLPRFSKIGIEIEVLQFKPYTEQQLFTIINNRINIACKKLKLNQQQKQSLFEPQTLELISKHVSTNNSDIRKAFDVFRRLVSLKFEKYIQNADDDDSLEEDPSEEIKLLPNEYCFTMDLVLEVISEFFESKTISNIKNLPIHAQLILFSSFLSTLNYKTLYESYVKQCSLIDFTPISKIDFSFSIDCIVSNGLMTMLPNKLESNRKITLNFSKEDLNIAFKDSVIFSSLLG